MSLTNLHKCPWPYFGGKSGAAPAIWEALGDVDHYVEPFCGSLATLLLRPHEANRTYHSETVNDADGLLVNAWRSIQWSPDATAEAASWPVAEADVHARHLAILRWQRERDLERLMGDPKWHDPEIAGWWIWGACCWIGSGWASGRGPWVVSADGRMVRREGKGEGTWKQLPHLSDNGRGVNHAGAREPGVKRQLPHLGSNGQGVIHAGTREPGVSRQLPHLGDDGRGVNRPQAREPGVKRQRPHLGDDGQGVNRPQAREPGVKRQLPHLGSNGQGVNHAGAREPGVILPDAADFHPVTMPDVRRWFAFLSARLRHVRILNGDWKRAVTGGASKPITVRMGDGHAGIFLDPPYRATGTRDADLYTNDDGDDISAEVRAWCEKHGDDPKLRIVLAGFAGEGHEALTARGWREVEWFKAGFLKGGMAQTATRADGDDAPAHQQHLERLWFSPACIAPRVAEPKRQPSLFDLVGEAAE